jgi:acyl dehydratase
MAMRAVVDHFVDGETSLGSPGLGPIRWKLPVRPDDELAISLRVVDARRSISKPDRGTIVLELEMRNQRDEVVMLIENWAAIIRARTTGDPT